MGYRSYDWECRECGNVRWHLAWSQHGTDAAKWLGLQCDACGRNTNHDRIISLVAEYHGEKVLNPTVYGGAFDTAGARPMHTMPELPNLPPDASRNDCKERVDAYRERFNSKEWKEIKAANKSIAKENAAKQRRLAALERGENVNMRRDKLPGDPKVTA